MKKIVALILCVLSICLSVSALAVEFYWLGSDTKSFRSWHSGYVASEGSNWYLNWSQPPSNLAANRRAYLRLHKEDNSAASASWSYATPSSSSHAYNTGDGYGNSLVQLRGRLDDRDGAQAPLIAYGFLVQ